MLSAHEWRPMREADLAALTAISDAVHGEFTEPLAVFAERLALFPAGCRVWGRAGAVGGYLISHPWPRDSSPPLGKLLGAIPPDADSYYLHDIALLPAERGAGAGRAALDFVIGQARAGGFADITRTAVHGADRYWAARGFAYVDAGAQTSYGEGTYLMRRAVSG